ncbi:hypothetical protein [Macrococcus brunensis]|uniref:hypothetical protein n=1 Tax=Macrococcus brunensis TaxID=198483 RepID=UPI001EEFD09A|nr:hypothetical protein [Macrococcus brunensis]ULG71228.1 hypothetical protein MGG12_07715 [Macrococcus brunensis]
MTLKSIRSIQLYIAVIMSVLLIAVSCLVLIQRYFNYKEINSLTAQADARGYDYELTIHNDWTGDYSFKVKSR